MNMLYHLGKDNVVEDACSILYMGSIEHIKEERRELGKMFTSLLA